MNSALPVQVEAPESWPCEIGDGREFIAASPVTQHMRDRIAQVAAIDVPLLLLGETGVGKEMAARLAHELSPRRSRPFLKVNCAALPADLLESELFGYEPGAFTGASHAKPGKFELCHQGTIFLDEIGELAPALQAKLLQVLEDRQFSRLGGRRVISVDVRIVAATNLEMQAALASRRFREDLYYRLSAVTVAIPPLRERRAEILPLLEHFRLRLAAQWGRTAASFPPELIASCQTYHWPGNVRELQNFVKRFLLLGAGVTPGGDAAQAATGPRVIDFPPPAAPVDLKAWVRQLKSNAETRAIHLALTHARGNRNLAAKALGISAKSLLHKIRQYEIGAGLPAVDDGNEASCQVAK